MKLSNISKKPNEQNKDNNNSIPLNHKRNLSINLTSNLTNNSKATELKINKLEVFSPVSKIITNNSNNPYSSNTQNNENCVYIDKTNRSYSKSSTSSSKQLQVIYHNQDKDANNHTNTSQINENNKNTSKSNNTNTTSSNQNTNISKNIINTNKVININYSKFTEEVLYEINLVRTQPLLYIKKIRNLLMKNNSKDNMFDFGNYSIRTIEGQLAFKEAIAYLQKKLSPLKPLNLSVEISKSASELLNRLIINENYLSSPEYIKFNNIEKRVNKYVTTFGDLSEIVEFGSITAEYLVINLIACDGDCKRANRDILFNENLKFIGIASNSLPSMSTCTIIDFSELYYNLNDPIPKKIISKYDKSINNVDETINSFSKIPINGTNKHINNIPNNINTNTVVNKRNYTTKELPVAIIGKKNVTFEPYEQLTFNKNKDVYNTSNTNNANFKAPGISVSNKDLFKVNVTNITNINTDNENNNTFNFTTQNNQNQLNKVIYDTKENQENYNKNVKIKRELNNSNINIYNPYVKLTIEDSISNSIGNSFNTNTYHSTGNTGNSSIHNNSIINFKNEQSLDNDNNNNISFNETNSSKDKETKETNFIRPKNKRINSLDVNALKNQLMTDISNNDLYKVLKRKELPNNVDKIRILEKIVNQEGSSKNKTLVKKIIYYKDGSTEKIVYEK